MKIKLNIVFLSMLAGWINRQQQAAINYFLEENRIRNEKYLEIGRKRIILNDRQRRRLAILAKRVGRKMLFDISGIFSPDTVVKRPSDQYKTMKTNMAVL